MQATGALLALTALVNALPGTAALLDRSMGQKRLTVPGAAALSSLTLSALVGNRLWGHRQSGGRRRNRDGRRRGRHWHRGFSADARPGVSAGHPAVVLFPGVALWRRGKKASRAASLKLVDGHLGDRLGPGGLCRHRFEASGMTEQVEATLPDMPGAPGYVGLHTGVRSLTITPRKGHEMTGKDEQYPRLSFPQSVQFPIGTNVQFSIGLDSCASRYRPGSASSGVTPDPEVSSMNEPVSTAERNYGAAAHVAALVWGNVIPVLGSFAVTLLVWWWMRESAFVVRHARASINFQISMATPLQPSPSATSSSRSPSAWRFLDWRRSSRLSPWCGRQGGPGRASTTSTACAWNS